MILKKPLTVAIILLFISVSVIPSTGTTDVKQITIPTNSGNTLYVGGSGSGNYTKIQDAIDNASSGDTVFVFSGLYVENVYINRTVNLLGENQETTIIDANVKGSPIYLDSSNVLISGFTVQNSEERCAGIDKNNFFSHYNNNTISGNKIINNNFGIYLTGSSNISISNNEITHNRRHGIRIRDCNLVKVENNIITKNSELEWTGDAGIGISHSHRITIRKNRIDGNHISLYLYQAYSCNISKNSLCNNSAIGIFLTGDSNLFYSNNFINNTKDVDFIHIFLWSAYCFTGRLRRNHFIKNYWDDYSGIGPKGIIGECHLIILTVILSIMAIILWEYPGEILVSIKWFYFDWLPASEPYDIGV